MGYLKLVLFLVICCFEVVRTDSAADEKFFNSAREGDTKYVEEYLEANPSLVSARDSRGNNALVIAAGRGKIDILRILLKYRANPEDHTNSGLFEGKSALSWAASQGRAEAVQLLLQAGANARQPAVTGVFLGKTPLMWASSQGRTEVVRLLLLAGVDVNHSSHLGNFKGKSCLMWASSQGRVDTVAVLLEAGADVNAVDEDGVSALMWASGSEVKEGNEDHQKGLLEKATKGHIDVVRLLLKYGAQPDMRDKDGITAIMYACFHGHAGVVKAFLNEGADADFRNMAGRTALQLAQKAGFEDAAKALLDGPNIMSLPVSEMVQVSACGWLLSVLRAPSGTGIYFPLHQPLHGNEKRSGSAHTLATSCNVLSMNGLDDTLGELLLIVHKASVTEVVAHLGITQYAAKVRATDQLKRLFSSWVTVYYPEVPQGLLAGSDQESFGQIPGQIRGQNSGNLGNGGHSVNRGDGGGGGSGGQIGQGNSLGVGGDGMCAHLLSLLERNCLGSNSRDYRE